ncbi:hypothetical protein ABPG72_007115 [Tetrahymena utriculariae]
MEKDNIFIIIDDNFDETNVQLETNIKQIINRKIQNKLHLNYSQRFKNKIDQTQQSFVDQQSSFNHKIPNDNINQNKKINLEVCMEQYLMTNNINQKRKQANIFVDQDSFLSEDYSESQVQQHENFQEIVSKKRQKINTKQQIRQKQNNYEKIVQEEEPFQMDQFSWKINKKTHKRYLEKNQNLSQNNRECFKQFDDLAQIQTLGVKIHSGIKTYLECKKKDKLQLVLKDEDVDLIIYQVDITTKYLNLRGMKNFKVETKINYNHSFKIIDYLAYSDEQKECIIVDWKFSDLEVKNLIKKNEKHFQDQIIATQQYFDYEYKVSLLVIPLKNIDNLKFIEYTIQKEIRYLLTS